MKMLVLRKSVTIYFIINLTYYVNCTMNSPSFFKSFMSKFDQCVAKVQGTTTNLISCFGHPALDSLQEIENLENFTIVEGVSLVKAEGPSTRNINWLDQDPTDVRTLMENFGFAMSERSIQWDMGRIYPGLQLKIGPSLGANSVMEFYMDPGAQYDERMHYEEQHSTARILTRKFVLPFLLGLKFNIAALLPIIIGIIILISKKVAFLSKLALFIINIFGAGGLIAATGFGPVHGGIGHGGIGHGGYGFPGHGGLGAHYSGFKDHDPIVFRTEKSLQKLEETTTHPQDHFYEYDKKQQLLRDRTSRLYERGFNVASFYPQGSGKGPKVEWHTIE